LGPGNVCENTRQLNVIMVGYGKSDCGLVPWLLAHPRRLEFGATCYNCRAVPSRVICPQDRLPHTLETQVPRLSRVFAKRPRRNLQLLIVKQRECLIEYHVRIINLSTAHTCQYMSDTLNEHVKQRKSHSKYACCYGCTYNCLRMHMSYTCN
jgi:hypothetical protein